MSSTATDVQSLCHPLLAGLWINTPVRRAACQGVMGRDHLHIKSERGIINGQTPSMELSLAPSAMLVEQAQGKRKTRHLRRTYSTSGFSLFLPSIILAPPLSIKRRVGHPHYGDRLIQHTSPTHLSSNRALGILLTIPSETWDLSLSRPFVPPTTNYFQC